MLSCTGLLPMTETTGALVIGGNLNGLSIARSLGRRGVPVWVTSPPNIKLASYSRYTRRTLPWPNGDCEGQAAYLLELAERYQLNQCVLFPTSDESAALLSEFHPRTRGPKSVIAVPLSKRLTSLRLSAPHSACWLQAGTLEGLKVNTSVMLEMDARSFWTLIQGCGHGRRRVAARWSTFPISSHK